MISIRRDGEREICGECGKGRNTCMCFSAKFKDDSSSEELSELSTGKEED